MPPSHGLFEIASESAAGTAVEAPADLLQHEAGWLLARAVLALDTLPPGPWLARARLVTNGGEELARVVRPFTR